MKRLLVSMSMLLGCATSRPMLVSFERPRAALREAEAQADADLALSLAKEATVRTQALRAASEVSSLKGEP